LALDASGGPGPTPTPTPDADRDGVPAVTDCDDTNSKVYPGGPEVAGAGIDQDCSGANAAGRVSALVAFNASSSSKSTKFVAEGDRGPGGRVSRRHVPRAGVPELDDRHHVREGLGVVDQAVSLCLPPER